jgi:hypothetical protein
MATIRQSTCHLAAVTKTLYIMAVGAEFSDPFEALSSLTEAHCTLNEKCVL